MIEVRPATPGTRCGCALGTRPTDASRDELAAFAVTYDAPPGSRVGPRDTVNLCLDHARDFVFVLALNGQAR